MVPCKSVMIRGSKLMGWFAAVLLFAVYSLTAPQNHSEAEDVYDFALQVEQGSFADQVGVNRVLALPLFGSAYRVAQVVGYSGRAFSFMILINRILAVCCLYLFSCLLSYRRHPVSFISYRRRPACSSSAPVPAQGIEADVPPEKKLRIPNFQLQITLLLAFSYGFWRYANEAETYILASFFVLGAWCLVLRGKWAWSVGVSALGVMIHLLNLIPLLLIIPLYYLLSKEWKKALLHGALTGLLVVAGYWICSPWLDVGELGAQHHGLEGGLSLSNLLRGGIAFGQNLVSANFLFGFEGFRGLLAGLFPSRVLAEEFFLGSKMATWIPWVGVATLSLLGVSSLWFGVKLLKGLVGGGETTLACAAEAARRSKCGDSAPLSDGHEKAVARRHVRKDLFFLSCFIWLLLYAIAVARTEAGSPELWIMALIPFWLLVGLLMQRAREYGQESKGAARSKDFPNPQPPTPNYPLWVLVILLFTHNLIAGLLPVLSEKTDYHVQKGRWLLGNTTGSDVILTSYEPVMIFYLNYYVAAQVVSSSDVYSHELDQLLGKSEGAIYALHTFFQPMESMAVRYPALYERMFETGQYLLPKFGKIEDNEFGGIYRLQCSPCVIGVGE